MSNNTRIQLGQHQFVRGTNQDIHLPVSLTSSHKELNEYDIVRMLSLNEQFHQERNASGDYRFHGTIRTLTPLTGRKGLWDSVDDMFEDGNTTFHADMGHLFHFYLCYPAEMTRLNDTSNLYVRKAAVLSHLRDFELLPCGFGVTAFNERLKNFVLDEKYPLDQLRTKYDCTTDEFGVETCSYLPVTEVFVLAVPKNAHQRREFAPTYAEYDYLDRYTTFGFREEDVATQQPLLEAAIARYLSPFATTGERSFARTYRDVVIFLFRTLDIKLDADNVFLNQNQIRNYVGLTIPGNYHYVDGISQLAVGETLTCDLVAFDQPRFALRKVDQQACRFRKTLTTPNLLDTQHIFATVGITYTTSPSLLQADFQYQYAPFLPIKIRDYSAFLETAALAQTDNVPYYAVPVNGEEVVWKDLLDRGYQEPGTGQGVDYPFINGSHYIFAPLTLVVQPDLSQENSFNAYRSYVVQHQLVNYEQNINHFDDE